MTQGYGVWSLRHAVRWRSAAPFIVGGLIGVPAGTMLLTYIDPAYMRIGGRRTADCLQHLQPGSPGDQIDTRRRSTEVGVGFLNGLLAGLTGLVGIIVVIWCQLRNWPKDVQRAIFQPVLLATILDQHGIT